MNEIILTLALICPTTIIENNTSTWTNTDKQSLSSAKKRCKVYYPDSPCLKKFIKKEESVYWAICSQKIKK